MNSPFSLRLMGDSGIESPSLPNAEYECSSFTGGFTSSSAAAAAAAAAALLRAAAAPTAWETVSAGCRVMMWGWGDEEPSVRSL
jgi:hypothetical protein